MSSPLLLYDGTCGLCARSVQFVLRHERTRTLRFAALDGVTARAVLARHPALMAVDSVVWVEPARGNAPERVRARSAAVLRMLRHLGGFWHLLRVAWLVPRPLRDAAYDLVARHRHRVPGACVLPAPADRARFLD